MVVTVHRMDLGSTCGDLLRIGPLAGSPMNRTFCGILAKATAEDDLNEDTPKENTIIHATNKIPDAIVSLTEELFIDFFSDLNAEDGGAGKNVRLFAFCIFIIIPWKKNLNL